MFGVLSLEKLNVRLDISGRFRINSALFIDRSERTVLLLSEIRRLL
jgi:hypothetical protein